MNHHCASQRPASASEVILGIDTHLEVHVAVALDGLGRRLGELNVPTTVKGYRKLLHYWAEGFGALCVLCRCGRYRQLWGCSGSLVEGCGRDPGSVMEVERPKRRHLRRNGKSDPIDAEAALLGRSWPTTRPQNPRALMLRCK